MSTHAEGFYAKLAQAQLNNLIRGREPRRRGPRRRKSAEQGARRGGGFTLRRTGEARRGREAA